MGIESGLPVDTGVIKDANAKLDAALLYRVEGGEHIETGEPVFYAVLGDGEAPSSSSADAQLGAVLATTSGVAFEVDYLCDRDGHSGFVPTSTFTCGMLYYMVNVRGLEDG